MSEADALSRVGVLNHPHDQTFSSILDSGKINAVNSSRFSGRSELLGFRRFARSVWNDFSARRVDPQTTIGAETVVSRIPIISTNNAKAQLQIRSPTSDALFALTQLHLAKPMRSDFIIPDNPWVTPELNSRFDSIAVDHDESIACTRSNPNQLTNNTVQSRKVLLCESSNNLGNITLRYSDLLKNPEFSPSRRVVQIRSLPHLVGIKMVMSQVAGGPLMKIVLCRDDKTPVTPHNVYMKRPLRNCTLELWFMKPVDAYEFMAHCSAGNFIVNGFRLFPEWAPPHNCYSDDKMFYHEPVPPDVKREFLRKDGSRCLILKRTVPVQSSHYKLRTYDHPNSFYVRDFDINDVRIEFSGYGDISDVCPVVSRKLAVSIHYFDIASAMAAKQLFDDPSSALHNKFYGWSLHYLKDSTAKPCPNIT
ncbi:Sporulation-specific protein 2 [Cyberlindnera fabianii]|uniref:Sporulation-specific protein 2 n=1 Tax=Cyberlindnera fabianii TaxID=36022 RepID=A0A1V2LBP9_CYBFA|nr:Sporulation-specific protein 2 [Cyberlindnera fabianii]